MPITLEEFITFIIKFVDQSLCQCVCPGSKQEEYQIKDMQQSYQQLINFKQIWINFKTIVKDFQVNNQRQKLQNFITQFYNNREKVNINKNIQQNFNGKGLFQNQEYDTPNKESSKILEMQSNQKIKEASVSIISKDQNFKSCKSINEKLSMIQAQNEDPTNYNYEKSNKKIGQSNMAIKNQEENQKQQLKTEPSSAQRQKLKNNNNKSTKKLQEQKFSNPIFNIDRKISYQQLQRKPSYEQNLKSNGNNIKQSTNNVNEKKQSFQKILNSFKKLCSTFQSNHHKLLREDFTNKYINT